MDLSTVAINVTAIFSPWGALGVAYITLKHSTKAANDKRVATTAAHDATLALTVTDIIARLGTVINDMKAEAELFRQHDLKCVEDKTKLAAQLAQNTRDIERVNRVLSNLERRVGYQARDEAARETHRRLTGEST